MASMPVLLPADIESVVVKTLATVGVSPEDFESRKATLLQAEPPWPGQTWEPADPAKLASYIDHTLLKPDATDLDIWRLCLDARAYKFASVCVNSCHLKQAVKEVGPHDIKVCCVVGFPLGAMAPEAKAAEAEYAVENGAAEVDMVLNIGKIKTADAQGLIYALEDIRAVTEAAWGIPAKVILETALLTPQEIVAASVLSVIGGAAFVKTSTGFCKSGATLEDVALMRQVVGPNLGIKASGGIRDYETATRMIRAGANRLGTSNGIAIIKRQRGDGEKSY